MTQNAGEVANFGIRRLETLATYIRVLREQLTRMEKDWDDMRSTVDWETAGREGVYERVEKIVDDSKALGEDVLDKAEAFMTLREKQEPAQVEDIPADLAQVAAVSLKIPFVRVVC